ncbi:hypothetical protein C8R43DRAFT_641685 [Mycena crocata]|nr:hypothetical protein C8R43DRAFT_641685 [Mycena crocata]
MFPWAILWCLLPLAVGQVFAAANKTIDDLEPHTHYNDVVRINGGCCVVQALSGDTAEFGLDSTQVNNGTVSRIVQNTIPADLKLMQMEMNFTVDAPGAGLYLYFAHDGGSGGATDFFLDNVLVGNFSVELDSKKTPDRHTIYLDMRTTRSRRGTIRWG